MIKIFKTKYQPVSFASLFHSLPQWFSFIVLGSLLACTSQTQEDQKEAIPKDTIIQTTPNTSTDTLQIDLVALKEKGQLQPAETITIPHDPVFLKSKTFKAIPLQMILNTFSSVRRLDASQTQVIFECEDGYSPSMPLQQLMQTKVYLATQDTEAPKGEEWVPIKKKGHETKIAPFYIVYTEADPKDNSYKWPYNLVRIRLVPVSSELTVLFPKDERMVKGYNLFHTNCFTCHSINGIGGKMGPELNYPKNVTEYWQPEHLKAFVKNPSSYRNDCKMPTLTNISDADITAIIQYIGYMKDFKTLAKR
ncbi:cytochrome c [Cytophagaceae bacterium DM2B3-1]|uniref:Cytochrome c n=1 Tax=Xanthocytophaga flava TaxID=3048013 RepID=A0ABT7CDU5_9BACT|nr:cytochrome c [Xanthocytophaga flavus]MDJ1472680.1 cytochrome c [Xanthocytophaga flavus]MDJ1491860.1 cytochrome c [Xanthocytophaga flavus]